MLSIGTKLKVWFLPSPTKLRRLCFYRCMSVHRGGWGICLSACWDTPREQTTPPEQRPPRAETPPEQTPCRADTPRSRHPLPRADTPWSWHIPPSRHPPQADTPQSRHPPWSRPPRSRHPPKIRPLLRTVGILLECILVCLNFYLQIQRKGFSLELVFVLLAVYFSRYCPEPGLVKANE